VVFVGVFGWEKGWADVAEVVESIEALRRLREGRKVCRTSVSRVVEVVWRFMGIEA
jgi:hypothetical protein